MSVYRLSRMPIQSFGQSVSAPRRKAGARLNAHTELLAKRQRSAREVIYRDRPIDPIKHTLNPPAAERLTLKYDKLPQNFAFNLNVRLYRMVAVDVDQARCLTDRNYSPFQTSAASNINIQVGSNGLRIFKEAICCRLGICPFS